MQCVKHYLIFSAFFLLHKILYFLHFIMNETKMIKQTVKYPKILAYIINLIYNVIVYYF